MREEILDSGNWTISALYEGDESPAITFLVELNDATERRFTHLFKETLLHGPPKAVERFRHLGNGIYEFKTYDGFRMFCFQIESERKIVLTHGDKKPKPKALRNHVGRALEMRQEYLQQLQENDHGQ